MQIVPLSQLVPRSVNWLWPGRLALGKLAILDGDPDLGKSLVTLDLCARLSTGRDFPDGQPSGGPANSVVLSDEDNAEDTILPRIQALGGNPERVFVMPHNDSGSSGPFRIPTHLDALDAALERMAARLLVIDPIVAFLEQGAHFRDDQSVRRALSPLAALAERRQCVAKMVRHLNKSGASRSLYRGGGSIGIVAACRSAWLAVRDPNDPKRCVLAQVKNNLAAPQPSLVYEVQRRVDAPPTLAWHGTSELRADQLLAAAARIDPLGPRQRARDFLLEFLRDGPRLAREFWPVAQRHGLSKRTLWRARRDLDIRSHRLYMQGRQVSYWCLPGQVPPSDPTVPDLEPWLAPLREQFPPSTPLDDL
jgi:hypothetical protein